MEVFSKINCFIEKFMPCIAPLCLLVGILAPQYTSRLLPFVTLLFAFMTFQGSMKNRFQAIGQVFRHPLPMLCALFVLHIWMPLLARLCSGLFFGGAPDLVSGFVLAFVVPTGIVSFMWVGIYRGSAPQAMCTILLDTLLAPFLVPLSLRLLLGASVPIDTGGMMRDMLLMVGLPALAGTALNEFSHGWAKEKACPVLAPFAKLALILVISANSSKVAPFVQHLTPTLVGASVLVLLLSASGYVWAVLLAKFFHFPKAEEVALSFNGGMRNISAGAVLAGAYFPDAAMFPVMIGTLFQQILAALNGMLLSHKRGDRRAHDGQRRPAPRCEVRFCSQTGNTRAVAQAVRDALPPGSCGYFGGYDRPAGPGPLLLLCFWTDRGDCPQEAAAFMRSLHGKRVALCGTAGFGASQAYFEQVLQRVRAHLPPDCAYLGGWMCQGKMGDAPRARYAAQLARAPQDEAAKTGLENWQAGQSHPDAGDLAAAAAFARGIFVQAQPCTTASKRRARMRACGPHENKVQ